MNPDWAWPLMIGYFIAWASLGIGLWWIARTRSLDAASKTLWFRRAIIALGILILAVTAPFVYSAHDKAALLFFCFFAVFAVFISWYNIATTHFCPACGRHSRNHIFATTMRGLMAVLLISCVICTVSAITGIQAFEADSRTGTVVSYWHGYWRLLPLFYAAISALAFYGIYRHYPVVWKLGWVFLIGSAVEFIVLAWLSLIHQPYGWVGAIAATLGGIGVSVYWGFWWQKQKSYFFPDATE